MSKLLEDIRNKKAGIRMTREDWSYDEDLVHDLADALVVAMDFDIKLYDYNGEPVYDYLMDLLGDGWNHLCLSDSYSGTLCGCKSGYFENGSGKGQRVIPVDEFIFDIMGCENQQPSDCGFELVF